MSAEHSIEYKVTHPWIAVTAEEIRSGCTFEALLVLVFELRKQLKESDGRVAEFERIVDASREVLHTELWDVKHGRDILSMCCCARELLADKRRDDKKEF